MKRVVEWLFSVWGGSLLAGRVAASYRDLFDGSNPSSRDVLADLSLYCGFERNSFVAGDPHLTSFNEGMRSVYLHILEMASVAPGEVPSLTIEVHHERERNLN